MADESVSFWLQGSALQPSSAPARPADRREATEREYKDNHLLFHAMAPNVAGVIGSAIAAGVFIAIFR